MAEKGDADAKRIRRDLLERVIPSIPESSRPNFRLTLNPAEREIFDQLVSTTTTPPEPTGQRLSSASDEDTKALCREFLSEIKWPNVKSVDLDRVKLAKSNVHGSKAYKQNMRQTPEKPGTPVMLFHKLLDDVEKPFSKGETLYGDLWTGKLQAHHIVLLGPSGCGKTRKLLELLVRKKGYYLIPRSDNLDDRNYGSHALYEALTQSNLIDLSSVDLWSTTNDDFDRRRKIVEFAVSCVLLSYAMIHHTWSEWLHKKKAKPVSAKAWLLVQLFPKQFLGRDWFMDLAQRLSETLPFNFQFSPSLFPSGFVCAIDEAQVFGDFLVNKFLSSRSQNRNSLGAALSPILRATQRVLGCNVILSGTGLSMLKATIWKSLVSNIGTTNATAEQFLFCDFQPLTLEDVLGRLKDIINYHGSTRLDEVARWLVGRPRFLATFIEDVISNSHDAEAYVSIYVSRMTSTSFPRTPGALLSNLAKESAEILLGHEPAPNLYSRFLLNTYWMSNGLSKVMDANPSLVELGLGYPRTIAGGEPPFIQTALSMEPLILESARHRRLQRGGSPALDDIANTILLEGMDETDRGKRFKYIVSDRLVSALLGRRLEDFDIFCRSEAILPESMRDYWCAPEWLFGQYAITAEDNTNETRLEFYKWMEDALDPTRTMIRTNFPSNSTGPDIVFIVCNQARTKVLPVFVQVKPDLDTDSQTAFYTVDPALFDHQNRGTGTASIVNDNIRNAHAHLLKRLLSPVLRIVISSKKADSGEPMVRLVPYERGDQQGYDVSLFLDKTENETLFGKSISGLIANL